MWTRLYQFLNSLFDCLAVNPFTVDNFAYLFNCTPVCRAPDSMMEPTINLCIRWSGPEFFISVSRHTRVQLMCFFFFFFFLFFFSFFFFVFVFFVLFFFFCCCFFVWFFLLLFFLLLLFFCCCCCFSSNPVVLLNNPWISKCLNSLFMLIIILPVMIIR